jgi:hypothetical protein
LSGRFLCLLQRLTAYTVSRFLLSIRVNSATAAPVSVYIRASFVFKIWSRLHLRNHRAGHISATF